MQEFTISIENTTNQDIIKFISNGMLTDGSFEYNSIEDATNSALVQQLFHLPFVKNVFVTANFMAVERYPIVEWDEVKEELRQVIENYLNKNGSLFAQKEQSKKMPVQIYAESTPNPEVLKFVTNKLLTSQNIEIVDAQETRGVPLADALFNFPFVKEIFISENYISITKTAAIDWFEITNELRAFLKTYVEDGREVVNMDYAPVQKDHVKHEQVPTTDLDDISQEIVAILDEYIKPAVTSDGGNIMFQSYDADSKIVNVVLQGACSGCPSSTFTLKNGIENTLKQLLPNKITEVVAING